MSESTEPPKEITAVPSPFPKREEIASKTQIQRTKDAAKVLGMQEKSKDLSEIQKTIRVSLLSFTMISITLFFKWLFPLVDGNIWLGTWEDVVEILWTVAVVFTQVVLAKVKAYYDGKKIE
jgi:hypothetical protein